MLVVALGNPGNEYKRNRHNVGWIFLDKLSEKYQLRFSDERKHNASICKTNYKDRNIIFAKPLTYMNLSGIAVQSLSHFYKIPPKDIIVIHDDKDFNIGTFKIRIGGSAAGHNGIKSIISSLGTDNFIRFRIGIGPKPKEIIMSNYVLQNFSENESKILNSIFNKLIDAFDILITEGYEKAMNLYNRKDNK
jgi:PTH1 family peptidyl-tRNA hydrolase